MSAFNLQSEIEQVCSQLGIHADDMDLKSDETARQIVTEVMSRFTEGDRFQWLWAQLKVKSSFVRFKDDLAYRRVPLLIPPETTRLFFLAENSPSFLVY
jgi:hypothetical protein